MMVSEPETETIQHLETFKTYLVTQKQISPGIARNYFYSVRKFVRWANTSVTEGTAMQ